MLQEPAIRETDEVIALRALTSALNPSGTVHNGICCTSFADTYLSLGFRLAAFPYGAQSLPRPVAATSSVSLRDPPSPWGKAAGKQRTGSPVNNRYLQTKCSRCHCELRPKDGGRGRYGYLPHTAQPKAEM